MTTRIPTLQLTYNIQLITVTTSASNRQESASEDGKSNLVETSCASRESNAK